MATFGTCRGPVALISDRGRHALVVAKERTGANTAPTPETKSNV